MMLASYLISFLIGAIPFSVIIPWMLYKIDIRKVGSRNPGTTNVYRSIYAVDTKRNAILITVLAGIFEVLKGVVPRYVGPNATINCLVAVLGHIYSPFLGFSGGKGVATFFGAFIGATWNPVFIVPPILWITLTFYKKLRKLLQLDKEYVNLGPVKIKNSFVTSAIPMIVALLIYSIGSYPMINKIRFAVMFLFIVYQHLNYIVF